MMDASIVGAILVIVFIRLVIIDKTAVTSFGTMLTSTGTNCKTIVPSVLNKDGAI